MQRNLFHILVSGMMAILCLTGCTATEVTSAHNLRGGHIMTVVHGCGGFSTYRNNIPPNTWAAAEHALAQGADAIEMDVQITADGELVVFHDGLMERATDCSGCIGEMAAADVLTCQYQTKNGPLDGRHPVIRLDSMLARVHRTRPDAQVYLNTKHDSPCDPGNVNGSYLRFATALVAKIAATEMRTSVIVESMSAEFLETVRSVDAELVLLFDDEDFERGMQVVRTHHFLGLAISNGQVTEAQVRAAHAEGYWLGIWGVRVSNDTRRAVAKGPDFVMTDDLQMLQAALKK